MRLNQFTYIFAISVVFAFLDAFNIGANDVANSFSSSVASRSLKYWQAMILAAICELLGAVLVGSRVSDTIRTKIVDLTAFEGSTAGLMLTMMCALIGSSIWLSFATYIAMPVSTTHSISGALIGSGIAAVSAKNIIWGWKGFSQIIASWFIAPLLGGVISSIIFLITKFCVLETKNPVRNVFYFVPVVVFTTFSILTMLIVWKGAPQLKLDKLSTGATLGAIFGVGGVATILYLIQIHPVLYRRVVYNDWTLTPWDYLWGCKYWFASTDNIPECPPGVSAVPDYYKGKLAQNQVDPNAKSDTENDSDNIAAQKEAAQKDATDKDSSASDHADPDQAFENQDQLATEDLNSAFDTKSLIPKYSLPARPDGLKDNVTADGKEVTADNISWTTQYTAAEPEIWKKFLVRPAKWPMLIYLVLSQGFRHDVIMAQMNGTGGPSALSANVESVHQHSKIYDNRVEHMFAILQAVTACTMSFAHGSNDISNAAAPLSTVYLVWTTNSTSSKMDVPTWVLGFTGASLVLGVWLFGYRIMSVLGNKLIMQSPSRGFAIELGAAVTVVMATRLSIPVSTTQIATGCTVFVGLCNGTWRSINWRVVLWCYLGWIITLPCAGIIAGILNAIIIHAPKMHTAYQMS